MATVKSDTVYVDGHNFKREIKINARGPYKGLFTIQVPDSMAQALGIVDGIISAETLKDIERKWTVTEKAYVDASTRRRKIIAYMIEISAKIHRDDPNDDTWQPPVLDRDDISFAKGLSLSVSAGVFDLVTVRTGDAVNEWLEGLDSTIPESARLGKFDDIRSEWKNGEVSSMDWTAEREEFFTALVTQLEELILKLDTYLSTANAQALVRLIDDRMAGRLLPSSLE